MLIRPSPLYVRPRWRGPVDRDGAVGKGRSCAMGGRRTYLQRASDAQSPELVVRGRLLTQMRSQVDPVGPPRLPRLERLHLRAGRPVERAVADREPVDVHRDGRNDGGWRATVYRN